MKVLFYNWVDYLDGERRGGGVTVYQRNILRALDAEDGVEAWFLSSGISYDPMHAAPRWERVRHGPSENAARRFEIVNSGCLAPSHHSFGHETQVHCPETERVFLDFLSAKGPFDVVHFNSLEGVPAEVLRLKEHFPQTRVVASLHNYYPVCPQVNLWHRESETCDDFDGGRKCVNCLPHRDDPTVVRRANAAAFRLKKAGVTPGTAAFGRLFGPAVRMAGRVAYRASPVHAGAREVLDFPRRVDPSSSDAGTGAAPAPPHKRFARRRDTFVSLMNAHCDRILCVSGRVADVAASYGISRDRLQVCYIGTAQAEKFAATAPRDTVLKPDGSITLGYLGYMRRDKGFYFLMRALRALPRDMAARVNLVIGARTGDATAMASLKDVAGHIASVRHVDGYSHDTLDTLLQDVDVGVVPVLWEDNLPQVAIEMHARHIPLMTSDLGGARELGNDPSMVFRAGDVASLHEVVAHLLAGAFDAHGYWQGARAPTSMTEHLTELLGIYDDIARQNDAGPAPEGQSDDAEPLVSAAAQ